MAISRSQLTSVFTEDWVEGLRPAVEVGMIATGTISDPKSAEIVFTPGVGQVSTPSVKYTGKMRLQPLRSSNKGGEERLQAVQVSVPVDAFSEPARVGWTLRVTDSPLNSELESYVFTCIEVADASAPLERTLIFTVNHGLSV